MMKRGGWFVLLILAVALYVLYVKYGGQLLSQPSADLGEPQVASFYSNQYYSKQNNPGPNRAGTRGPIPESLFSTKA